MCDTLVALSPATARRTVLFGKNSDRQRNEAQNVELIAGSEHNRDATLDCTYIQVSQVPRTHAVLLSRPFWGWGAEMGANEHGVVIGNEGLTSRIPSPQEPALTGMDLVRLTLERAQSAAEGLRVLTELLERYGQGGNCGHIAPSYYHNGFLVADASEAFVIETVEREWMAERVHSLRAISNEYSIETKVAARSDGLHRALDALGAWDEPPPSYAEALRDPNTAHVGSAQARRARATTLLRSREGEIEAHDIMRILRDHEVSGSGQRLWSPRANLPNGLCIHAGAGPRVAQTTGAMVSELAGGTSVHWITGTAAPCISIFKPVLFGVPLPEHGPAATDRFDARTLWWAHERLHRRAVLGDLTAFAVHVSAERDALEASFRERVQGVLDADKESQAHIVKECWKEAMETEERWLAKLPSSIVCRKDPFTNEWHEFNEKSGIWLQ